jgi:hypothetical protein
LQTRDSGRIAAADLKLVTKRAPTDAERNDLLFAFRVAKHVKSNAIVYAKGGATVGIGAGQMSRVDSSRIAAWKAREAGDAAGEKEPRTKGCVVASDAFFPRRRADGHRSRRHRRGPARGSMRDAIRHRRRPDRHRHAFRASGIRIDVLPEPLPIGNLFQIVLCGRIPRCVSPGGTGSSSITDIGSVHQRHELGAPQPEIVAWR